jgi:hypothetical protein
MLRVYLLSLASASCVIGANEYCERQNGKGLLARVGAGRHGPFVLSLPKLVVTGFDADNSLGGCQ